MSSQMNRIIIMVLCVLAAELASCRDVPQTDYEIDGLRGIGLMNEVDADDPFLLYLDEAMYWSLSPHTLRDRLRQLVKRKTDITVTYRSESLGDTLSEINRIILHRLASDECFYSDAEVFLRVRAVKRSGDLNREAVWRYIEHFGPQKIFKCAAEARKYLKRYTSKDIDRFFKKLLALHGHTTDEQLYRELKKVNLLEDRLDFSRVVSFPREQKEESSSVDRVRGWIGALCDEMRKRIGSKLDFVNLSNALKKRVERDPIILKLAEFDHVCWYIKSKAEVFKENLERSLNLEQSTS
jgi:hypothetical protein